MKMLSNRIFTVSYHSDGHYIASGSIDKTIRIWDLGLGKVAKVLRGHKGVVSAVSYSNRGDKLYSIAADDNFRVWDIRAGMEINKPLPLIQPTQGAFNISQNRLAYASRDQHLRIIDLDSGEEYCKFMGNATGLLGISYSTDGNFLASTYYDGQVIIWDPKVKPETNRLTVHEGFVSGLDVSPDDGQTIATGGVDQSIRLWDKESGRVQKVHSGHTNLVSAIAFSPNNQVIASGSMG